MKNLILSLLCFCLPMALNAAEEATTQLSIETLPAGAEIFCDGSSRGPSPALISPLAPGEHLIVAEMEHYSTARQSVTVSKGQRSAVEMKLEQLPALAVIHTDPQGAEVSIEGISRGKTPLLITDLMPGKYRVKLQVEGFQAKDVELNLPDRTPVKLNVSLNSDSAKLTVNSQPAGAAVLLNGIAKGETPVEIDRIQAGNVTLELTLAGCAPYKQMLTLSAGQTENITAVLDAIPATLKVVSIPEKARVYVDNQFKGETPLTITDLQPGTFRVRAELRGHELSSRDVTIQRAAEITEEFRLTRNCGSMDVTTEPAGIKVFVDGEELGLTKASADASDLVSEPLTIDLLGIGPHKVQLTRAGYLPKELDINIEMNKTVTVHEQLKRMFIKNYTVRTSDATYEGMLLAQTLTGGIKIEIRPGIVKTFSAGDIISHGPLREDGQPAPQQ